MTRFAGGSRKQMSLDGAWAFRHESGAAGEAQVPGPWQAQFPELRNAMGRASYSRTFAGPELGTDEVAVLHFGAVSDRAVVRVNGVEVGRHEGGYLPFDCLLPDGLLGRENRVEVDCHLPDGSEDFAEIPHGKQSWYGPIGGIWQSVVLEQRARTHLTRLDIRADMTGRMDVEVNANGPGEAVLTVTSPDGRVLAQAQVTMTGQAKSLQINVPKPQLWSPESPALHTVTVTLGRDITEHRFGFRRFESREGKFFLNGQPFYMRAALDQDYYPETICTPPSEAWLEDQFTKARQLGLNMLRCHIKVPDPRYYEVADRMGLLIWTEIPNVAQLTEASARRLKETMEGILARDGNHPCLVIWTLINEDWGTRLAEDASHRTWLAAMYDWLKARDPSRLVVDNSPCNVNFHVKSDIDDFHYYRSVPERRSEWDALTAEFASRPAWTYSPHGDAQRRGDEPLVVSEFGVWGLPDPKEVRLHGAEPWWMGTGASWGDGAAYPHGIEQRFADLRLAATFGNFDTFITAVQGYQFANLKYQIESMRAQAPIQGYVITEFTDVHWESNGLLDMNRNPRSFHAAFATINADVVIVPKLARYAGWAGDVLSVGLSLATGGQTLPEAEIRWEVEGQSGRIAVAAASALSVMDTKGLELDLPALGPNRVLTLRLTAHVGERIVAKNEVEIALYQRPNPANLPSVSAPQALHPWLTALGVTLAAPETADLVLAQVLAPPDVKALQSGAKYLLLADGSGGPTLRSDAPRRDPPMLPWQDGANGIPAGPDSLLPNMSLHARHGTMWRGDWIAGFSWIRRTGAFAALPGGPLLDLSFDRVVPHHVLTGLRSAEFEGPVASGLVVGWVHKPAALIASRRVGRGGVLVSTFRLFTDAPGVDPVATTLLYALIATAAEFPVDPGV